MLNDNSLGERLNAVKTGKPIPVSPMQPNVQYRQYAASFWNFLLSKGLRTLDIFAASFLYGYGIRTVFSLDWSFIGALAVGFLLNHVILVWPGIIKNYFRK